MTKAFLLLLGLVLQLLKLQGAPGTEFFENILMEIPRGPFSPGEKVRFSCSTRKLHSNRGSLEWTFRIDESIYRQAIVDPEDDSLEILDDGLNRTSFLEIPWDGATGIACRWIDGVHEMKKIVNIQVLKGRNFRRLEDIYDLLDEGKGPQLVIERFDPEIDPIGSNSSSKYVFPDIVTNQTVELPGGTKSFRLSCFHLVGNDPHVEYDWTSSTDKTVDHDPVVLLNSLALVNQKAMTGGRFPSECYQNGSQRLQPGVQSEVLEVIIPPLNSPRRTKYTCKGGQFQSDVTIWFNGRTKATPSNAQDDEFLLLISTIMQILQSSNANEGGGGSGPLYGVGFGSTTIMVLMGLTIYYLKRQLKQLQEQIKENDLKKRKRTLVSEDEDDL